MLNKIKNRPYYTGHIPGGDPRNPLGKRWLGLNANGTYGDTYGIHGNNNESSIGKYVSQGCMRMHNSSVNVCKNSIGKERLLYQLINQ
ncbi:L,D-transpeptidase [Priestia megaterium]|uniref:L,D-transpeptidase n=1 Tax=Priestia megaterium TaxID=1404 RepID=UPI0026E34651|nr:L,D-transpeptidase [Priestia megaterium]MDO6851927.1 L,D-transpeptidase [Priestia megaterium]